MARYTYSLLVLLAVLIIQGGESLICTQETADSSSKSIQQINDTDNHGNEFCWVITSSYSNYTVRLHGLYNLGNGYNLDIRDGNSASAPLIRSYSGSGTIRNDRSTGAQIYVYRSASTETTGASFKILYNYINPMADCNTLTAFPSWTALESPNYPSTYDNDLDLCWVITSYPSSDTVLLEFLHFDLEHSNNCANDYVDIRDGDTFSSPLIQRYCGSDINPAVRSTGHQIYVYFHTNSIITGSGFSIRDKSFSTDCTSLMADSSWNYFQSPNYPSNYDNDLSLCWWITSADSTSSVLVEFLHFDLPSFYDDCHNDHLEIRDGGTGNFKLLHRYCGSGTYPDVISTGDQLYVYFSTDFSGTASGFRIQYKMYNPTTDCARLTALSSWNTFQSPNYPSNYDNNLSMCWIITTYMLTYYSDNPDQKMRLRLPSFDLTSSNDCVRDYLEIRDGGSSDSPLIGKYCGSEIVPYVTSTGYGIYVSFHTDSSDTNSGFQAEYKYIESNESTPLTAYSISYTFTSPNYPQDYANDMALSWIITSFYSEYVQLQFLNFDVRDSTNCVADFVEIRDGSNGNSSLIGRYCGSEDVPDVTSTGDSIYVYFSTDRLNPTGTGFEIQYQSTDSGMSTSGLSTTWIIIIAIAGAVGSTY